MHTSFPHIHSPSFYLFISLSLSHSPFLPSLSTSTSISLSLCVYRSFSLHLRALEQLNYLGALDDDGVLTQLGTVIAAKDHSTNLYLSLTFWYPLHVFIFPIVSSCNCPLLIVPHSKLICLIQPHLSLFYRVTSYRMLFYRCHPMKSRRKVDNLIVLHSTPIGPITI